MKGNVKIDDKFIKNIGHISLYIFNQLHKS